MLLFKTVVETVKILVKKQLVCLPETSKTLER
jgi:hypothetical protein